MTVSFSLSKRVKYDPRCPIFMTQKALLSQSVVDPQTLLSLYILNEAQTLLLYHFFPLLMRVSLVKLTCQS